MAEMHVEKRWLSDLIGMFASDIEWMCAWKRSGRGQVQLVRIKHIKTHSRLLTISATDSDAFNNKKMNNIAVIQIFSRMFGGNLFRFFSAHSHTLVKLMMSKAYTKSFVHMNDSLGARESKHMGAAIKTDVIYK